MLKPVIDDKVLIELVVKEVFSGSNEFRTSRTRGYQHPDIFSFSQIVKIIPAEPKVGDTVWWDTGMGNIGSAADGETLIAIHQADDDTRKWGVCAVRGNKPRSLPFELLRKTR